jgi:acyl-CoA synthetase (NDP forming)
VDAEEMLDRLRAARLLAGYRGQPPADRAALVDVIRRVSALVELAPELRELDLNPVAVQAVGEGAIVLDARIRLGAPA